MDAIIEPRSKRASRTHHAENLSLFIKESCEMTEMTKRRDDEDRLFLTRGVILNNRYRILDFIAAGTFSDVYACVDMSDTSRDLVLKACRNKHSFTVAATNEIRTVEMLMRKDPEHRYFVKYYGFLEYRSHMCLIFERLGSCLLSALRNNDYRPFDSATVRLLMRQIIGAVDVLHENGLVHTDLKLENVLLCGGLIDRNGVDISTRRYGGAVRLIDFGSVDTANAWHSHIATTRHYRAPEILLGERWSYECDIWSLGCIMVELAVGRIDFDAKDSVEHVFSIQEMIGPLPDWMWRNCTQQEFEQFAKDGRIRKSKMSKEVCRRIARKGRISKILDFDRDLCDVALLMLNPDPEKRPKARALLNHRFFCS